MAKLCKIMAVIMLIGGIIGSLILAGTTHALFVQRTGKYSIDSYEEAYNIEYATMGIGGSIAVFTVLYSFGALVEHVQRIDENLSKLVASQRRNKAADADSPKKTHKYRNTQSRILAMPILWLSEPDRSGSYAL